MNAKAGKAGRPPVKQDRVAAAVRQWIVDGEYQPGARLPPYVELRDRFGVNHVTLRRAMAQLKKAGFVVTRGANGTFVTDRPPHLYNIGMGFYSHPDQPLEWSRFYEALCRSAERAIKGAGYGVSLYYHLDGNRDRREHRAFAQEVQGQRFAGLILTSPQMYYAVPALREQPKLARVILASQPIPGEVCIYPDYEEFWRKAFAFVRAAGRTRVAALVLPVHSQDSVRQLCAQAAASGLHLLPRWVQSASPQHPEWAANCVEMLFAVAAKDRPEALIIMDDHLVEQGTRGLLAAKVRVPRDVTVVAHGNYGVLPTPAVPVSFLDFDPRRIIGLCLERLEQLRRGEKPPALTLVAPDFEENLK